MSEMSSKKERIFILDFMSMAFRYHHAMAKRPFFTSLGFPTSSIFGVVRALLNLVEKEGPQYMVAACDSKDPTFRHHLYQDYKAHRGEMPEDLSEQIPKLFQLFHILGIPVMSQAGVEADDIIATLAVWASQQRNLDVYIVSHDKDMMQLVGDSVKLYQTVPYSNRIKIVGEQEVKEYFGVGPAGVVSVQALMGDSVDNIPGVSGVGLVTAKKLIAQFQDLESLYQRLDDIHNPRVRQKLECDREKAFLSQKLVTLKKDLELSPCEDSMRVYEEKWGTHNARLDKFFHRCEFISLRKKYFPKSQIRYRLQPYAAAGHGPEEDVEEDAKERYERDEREESDEERDEEVEIKEVSSHGSSQKVRNLQQDQQEKQTDSAFAPSPTVTKPEFDDGHIHVYKEIGDSKTLEVLCEHMAEAATVSFSVLPQDRQGVFGFFIVLMFQDFGTQDQAYYLLCVSEQQKEWGREFLSRLTALSSQNMVTFDVKACMHTLSSLSVARVFPRWCSDDVMLAGSLVEGKAAPTSVWSLAYTYFYVHQDLRYKISTTHKKLTASQQGWQDQRENTIFYFSATTDMCLLLHRQELQPKIASMGLRQVYETIEKPLIKVVYDMERQGVYVDCEALNAFSQRLAQEMDTLKESIHQHAGEVFNVQSPKQLQYIIYEKLKIHQLLHVRSAKKTTLGHSTRESALLPLQSHPLVAEVLQYRKLLKLKSTYTDALVKLIHPDTGRVHTSFRQCGTVTGRMSSVAPNLQNIPIKTELGREIRRAFCASSEEYCVISADYSQIELRMLAHMSADTKLVHAFCEDRDVHMSTAAVMFGKEIAEVTTRDRQVAKAINYGIVYGMGPKRLAKIIDVSLAEAQKLIAEYFEHFSGVGEFLSQQIDFARVQGYTETMFHRRRALDEIHHSSPAVRVNAENAARNSPIQGSAADLMKMAMIKIYDLIAKREVRMRMLLQVHDELVFECLRTDVDEAYAVIHAGMEEVMEFLVPMKISIGHGQNWLEAH